LLFQVSTSPVSFPPTLHAALPIYVLRCQPQLDECVLAVAQGELADIPHYGGNLVTVHHCLMEKGSAGFGTVPEQRGAVERGIVADRKSTRLNSSHVSMSYAVLC